MKTSSYLAGEGYALLFEGTWVVVGLAAPVKEVGLDDKVEDVDDEETGLAIVITLLLALSLLFVLDTLTGVMSTLLAPDLERVGLPCFCLFSFILLKRSSA